MWNAKQASNEYFRNKTTETRAKNVETHNALDYYIEELKRKAAKWDYIRSNAITDYEAFELLFDARYP